MNEQDYQGKELEGREQWTKDGTLSNTNIKSRERKGRGKGKRNCRRSRKNTRRNLIYAFLPHYGTYTQTQVKKNNWDTLFPLFNHSHLTEGLPPTHQFWKTRENWARKTRENWSVFISLFFKSPVSIPSPFSYSKEVSKLLPSSVNVQYVTFELRPW